MQGLLQDIRYGLRLLAKNAGFTAVVVFTLGLGIGAHTTIFSIVNALIFTPLPFVDEERMVYLMTGNDRAKAFESVSYPDFVDCQWQNQVFDRMAVLTPELVNLTGAGEPVRIQGVKASSDLIPLMRVNPIQGRVFLPEEYLPGRDRVAILSNGLWQKRFGSRQDIAGKTVELDGLPHLVVGVLPAGFRVGRGLGFEPEFWMPFAPSGAEGRGSRHLFAVAHLKPGVTLERARSDLEIISRRLGQQAPETNTGWKLTAEKLKPEVDPIAYVFLAAMLASVLGITCVNVTNLLLAHASAREKEFSIRSALGATPLRIVRQLLTESLFLATLGAGFGIMCAYWACQLITALSADTNVGLMQIGVNARVLVVTVLVVLVVGVAVGLAPALQIRRINLNESLKEGRRSFSVAFRRWPVMNLLIVSEVAMSVLLLVGAGLVVKSWFHLWRLDLGFRPQKVLTLSLSLPAGRYGQGQQQMAFFDELLVRLSSRSEIQSAAVASSLPTASGKEGFWLEGAPQPDAGGGPQARFTSCSYQYFHALTIPLKAGRLFTAADNATALQVAIVNEAMVRKYWERKNPLGAQLNIAGKMRTIVGVVGDVKSIPLSRDPVPEVYVPFSQHPVSEVSLLIQTASETPQAMARAVTGEVQAVDPDQPVSRVRTMENVLSQNMGVINLGSALMGVLAVGGLVLATVGIYGVLSYAVARRTQEFGVRLALGAAPKEVLAIVMKQGLALVLTGVVLGLLGAFALGRLLASRIYGLSSFEVVIPLSVTGILLIIALAACYVPARRATRVSPLVAMRYE